MVRARRGAALGAVTVFAAAIAAAPAFADHPGEISLPALENVAGTPQNPVDVEPAPEVRRAEPPLLATPQGECGPGSRPETDIQGRVPQADHDSGRAAEGYTCNTKEIGRYSKPNVIGTIGGFKVERYVDDAGHECAFYDTTLLSPTNILDGEAGVNVLDMSDPSNPVKTATLRTGAMQSPHESLVLSKQRGVLAAVLGNPAFNVGIVDVYDVSKDCRSPEFKSTTPLGVFGHESGMAPDGKTFYSASPGTSTIVALDITNLSLPVPLGLYNYDSHGLSISNNGNRAYVAGVGSGLIILDTSQIQDRVANPQVQEISRLQWGSMSIPQNAIPVTIKGKKYAMEIDEFGSGDEVGAARMIDISDETKPKVVSNMRLAVHQPENFAEQAGDPGNSLPLQGYAGHYCNVPSRKDPGIVACSMILSGLRVFDIRDPKNPKEIAYFNAPVKPRLTPIFEASNWAMSSPSFVPERGEIWYSDGYQGFYAVKLTNGVWPFKKCRGKTVTMDAAGRVTKGTSGKDVIVGTKKNEVIKGGKGRDLICSKGGNDVVKGGPGNDALYGGNGSDRLRGGPGKDKLNPGFGKDPKPRP